jgi:hypothetical protein
MFSIKILEMDKSIQKALALCLPRLHGLYDPASYTGDLFHMTFAKLSQGSSSSSLGGCYQLLLAPRSKIANCYGIALCRDKCSHHCDAPSKRSLPPCQASLVNLFLVSSTRACTRGSSQASFRWPRNPLETSRRRDLPALPLANPE